MNTKNMPDVSENSDGSLAVKWSPEIEEFFKAHKVFIGYPWVTTGVYKFGEILKIPKNLVCEPYFSLPRKKLVSGGSFSYCRSTELPGDFVVGRYCSIAPVVTVGDQEHPLTRISTHPFTTHRHMEILAKEEFGVDFQVCKHTFTGKSPKIGHDVWIGSGAVIKRGVTIGTGAVIGAKALVTRDVPPFAIVGGIPAKIIRYRFDEVLIDRILKSAWWDYCFTDFKTFSLTNPLQFCDELEEKINNGEISEFNYKPMQITEMLREAFC